MGGTVSAPSHFSRSYWAKWIVGQDALSNEEFLVARVADAPEPP